MADPRFYDNRGPFTLAEICAQAGVALPAGADGAAKIYDVAALNGAGPEHLAFCTGRAGAKALAVTKAGFCFVGKDVGGAAPPHTVGITCDSAQHAFAAALRLFYPEAMITQWPSVAIDPSAKIAAGVVLAPGVVIGPNVEIGERTRIGPNTAIGRGVALGRDCEVGANASITNAYIGDRVLILSGAQIGQPGFGFASGTAGHVKMPQIGRVIVQDNVEIGACSTVDRGALGDTVIGEGTKIDNLVQIGHNTHLGRHCVIVGQVGISGSCDLGDFVVLGGQAGVADHATIGPGATFVARSGIPPGFTPGGIVYGGYPVRPRMEWAREVAAVARLAKGRGKKGDV